MVWIQVGMATGGRKKIQELNSGKKYQYFLPVKILIFEIIGLT